MRTCARAAALPALAVGIVAVMPLAPATSGGGHEPVAVAGRNWKSSLDPLLALYACGLRELSHCATATSAGSLVPQRTAAQWMAVSGTYSTTAQAESIFAVRHRARAAPLLGVHQPCSSSRQRRPTKTPVHERRSGCSTALTAGRPRGAGHRHASPANVYAATLSGTLRPSVAHLPARVYVPNSEDGTIDVINPATFRVVKRLRVGLIPHHITPSWDLTRLYVDNEGSGSLTVIDARRNRPIETMRVPFPYNLYFTPDGRKAIVAVERLDRLDFRNPHTWRLLKRVKIPWPGVDHLDFSADGRYLLASTEYGGVVVKVDTVTMKITGRVNVGGLPIDVRLAPDGSVFYVANQGRGGVSLINPVVMKEVGFLPTGAGTHGLAVSRDTKSLYVSNRLAGTISVISFRTRRVIAIWPVGGNPDMLQVSPDGRQLWASNRFDGTVSVVDTRTGRLLHMIPVGLSPHGLCYFPNAGRVSLGHNGVYR